MECCWLFCWKPIPLLLHLPFQRAFVHTSPAVLGVAFSIEWRVTFSLSLKQKNQEDPTHSSDQGQGSGQSRSQVLVLMLGNFVKWHWVLFSLSHGELVLASSVLVLWLSIPQSFATWLRAVFFQVRGNSLVCCIPENSLYFSGVPSLRLSQSPPPPLSLLPHWIWWG